MKIVTRLSDFVTRKLLVEQVVVRCLGLSLSRRREKPNRNAQSFPALSLIARRGDD